MASLGSSLIPRSLVLVCIYLSMLHSSQADHIVDHTTDGTLKLDLMNEVPILDINKLVFDIKGCSNAIFILSEEEFKFAKQAKSKYFMVLLGASKKSNFSDRKLQLTEEEDESKTVKTKSTEDAKTVEKEAKMTKEACEKGMEELKKKAKEENDSLKKGTEKIKDQARMTVERIKAELKVWMFCFKTSSRKLTTFEYRSLLGSLSLEETNSLD